MLASRVLTFAVLFGLTLPIAGQAPAKSASATQPQLYSLSQAYGALPLIFEPNQGQTREDVMFLSRGSGYSLFLTKGGMVLGFDEGGEAGGNRRLDIDFVGSSKSAAVAGVDQLSSRSNYLRGSVLAEWKRNVPNYSAVEYRGLYKGIDVRFYGNGNYFEHDFVVAPGADPSLIRLRIGTKARPVISQDGDVELAVGFAQLRIKRPQIYQGEGAEKRTIAGRYVLAGQDITIQIGPYDKSLPLIIDPVLVYSTYIAGSQGEFGNGLAIDASGNAYIVGTTSSTDFPMQNPLQGSCNNCATPSGFNDLFVSKLNPTGTGLIYSTYLGGSQTDEGVSIAVDSAGNAIVVGRTRSGDFPLVSPFRSGGVGDETFVASISADGSALNYSTYLGGSQEEFPTGVVVDSSGSAYVIGLTRSPDFPVTPGTRPGTPPASPNFEVFVSKLAAAGTLQFSLVIHGDALVGTQGGNSFMPGGIAVDSSGNSYITGRATAGWPTTTGSFQPNVVGAEGARNAFVAKLNSTASAFVYSTYLGNGGGWGKAIAVDASGNAYIHGDTESRDFPVTPGAFQTNTASCCRSFVTKLNSVGTALIYSSFLSGNETSFPFNEMIVFGIAVDGAGSAYATGRTKSRTFPVLNPVQGFSAAENRPFGDGLSTYVSKFNPAGSALMFSTYFGGSTGTEGRAIAVNPTGTAVYIAGTSFDSDLPTKPDAFQRSVVSPQFGDPTHPFVAKFDLSVPAPGACIAPRLISFSPQPVGTSSSPKVTTVTNCGSAPLHVSDVGTTSGFGAVSGCGAPVPPGGNCAVSVSFSPAIAGPIVGALQINDNAPVSPQSIRLEGRGAVPGIGLNFNNDFLSFSEQLLNTASPPTFFGLHNNGDADLQILDIVMSGDFAQTNNCSRVLPPLSQQCVFTLTFTPTATGLRTGAITIFHNAANSPLVIPLVGTGFAQAPAPVLSLVTPASAAIGSPAIAVMIRGQDFFPHSVLRLDGAALPTTYFDSGRLSVTLPPSAFTQVSEKSITVFTPGPGGGESLPLSFTVYRTVNLQASDLVFDPFSQMLYATIPSAATNSKNSIARVNPATGQVLQIAATGNDPAHLALSDDGQFLYVAIRGEHAVRRLLLPNLGNDLQIPLGLASNPVFGQLQAGDIKVIPGSPHSLVVAKQIEANLMSDGVVIYDDLTKRPSELTTSQINVRINTDALAFTSDPSTVFQVGDFGAFDLFKVGLSSSGATLLSASDIEGPTTGIASDGTLLYTTSGKVVDPANLAVVGSFIFPPTTFLPFTASVVPDATAKRTFFLDPRNGATHILGYDQATQGMVGSLEISGISTDAKSLVRWGTDGFAFLVPNTSSFNQPQLIIFRSKLATAGLGLGSSVSKLSIARGNTSLPITLKLSAPPPNVAPIDLSCTGLPFGASCNFSPSATVNVTPGSPATVTLTIHVPANAPFGRFLVSVIGRSSTGVASQVVDMDVNDFDVVLATTERAVFVGQPASFDGNLISTLYPDNANLSCAAGVTAAPSPCTVTPSSGKPSFNTAFTATATPSLPQNYLFNITATGTDANATVRSKPVILRAFDIAFGTFSQASVTTVPGSISAPITFQIAPIGPFNGPVTLQCAGLPAGARCAFNGISAPVTVPVPQAPAPVVLVITANSGVAIGSYPLNVQATTPGRPAGPLNKPLQLNVSAASGSTNLAVNVTTPDRAAHVGEQTTLTVSATNGSTSVANATLTIAFSEPQRVLSAGVTGGASCAGIGASSILLTCQLGAMTNGSTKEVTFTVIPRFVVAVRANVEVFSEFSDTNLLNNSAVLRQPVAPRPFVRRGLPPRAQ